MRASSVWKNSLLRLFFSEKVRDGHRKLPVLLVVEQCGCVSKHVPPRRVKQESISGDESDNGDDAHEHDRHFENLRDIPVHRTSPLFFQAQELHEKFHVL